MAIFHLRAKIIQRSNGQSAVKSAAYRHGERLWDERAGRAYFYRKPDVVHSAILAPDGSPEWVYSRSELWNRVEASERRVNSQPAREIEITLPRELSPEQRIALVHGFIKEHFVAHGMVADVAIHVPMGADGFEQPHAHCMVTKRRLDPSTPTGFAKTKARDWDEDPAVEAEMREAKIALRMNETPELAARVAEIDQRRLINVWRAAWADHANSALAAADAAARIDHRTLEAQGIAREAQPHLGLARHIEQAYGVLKDRVGQWISILKRNELYRAFAPYQRRDATQFAHDISAIASLADGLLNHWRQRPRGPRAPNSDKGVTHDW